jgi:REP element-mobilizing transposase RayT
VTVSARDHGHPFGEVKGGHAILSAAGEIVRDCLTEITEHHPHVRLDASVVMPDHVHVIIGVGMTSTPAAGGTMVRESAAPPASSVRDAQPRGRGEAGLAGETHTPGATGVAQPPHGPAAAPLGTIVGSFKAAVSRRLNAQRGAPASTIWKRGYHDHILRTQVALERARRYIHDNPARWADRAGEPPD